jgi:hypothetical protein
MLFIISATFRVQPIFSCNQQIFDISVDLSSRTWNIFFLFFRQTLHNGIWLKLRRTEQRNVNVTSRYYGFEILDARGLEMHGQNNEYFVKKIRNFEFASNILNFKILCKYFLQANELNILNFISHRISGDILR